LRKKHTASAMIIEGLPLRCAWILFIIMTVIDYIFFSLQR